MGRSFEQPLQGWRCRNGEQHMERCLASPVVREYELNLWQQNITHPLENPKQSKCWWTGQASRALIWSWGGRWMLHRFGTSLQPEYSSIYLSPTYSPSRKQRVHAETWIFRAALLVMAPNRRVTRCSSTRWWVNTLDCALENSTAMKEVHCWYLQRHRWLSGHLGWARAGQWESTCCLIPFTQSSGNTHNSERWEGAHWLPRAGGHLGARAADGQNVHGNNPCYPAFSQIGLYREILTQAQGDVANVPHSWMESTVGRKPLSTKN